MSGERDPGDEHPEPLRPLRLTREQIEEMMPPITRAQVSEVYAWLDRMKHQTFRVAAPAEPGGNSEEIPPPPGGEPAGVDRNR